MTLFKPWDYVNIFILALTTSLAILFVGQMPDAIATTTRADSYWYQLTAKAAPELAAGHRQPFAYRLLGPYLVGILPSPDLLGFRIVSIVSAVTLAPLFYFFLRYAGLSLYASLLSVILLTFNRYVFGSNIWNFTHVNDFLMMIILITLILAVWANKWVAFCIALVFGAMTREPTMLMIPVALFYLGEKKELSIRWRTVLLACAPGLAVLLLIRLFVPIVEGRSLTLALATFGGKLLEPASLFRLLVNTFLPFTLIPLVYFKATVTFFQANLHLLLFVILVFGTTLFGSNQERLMAPAFIVFYFLLGTILENVQRKRLTFLVLLIAAFLSSLHYAYGNWQLPDANWTRALTLASALVVTSYMAFFERGLHSQRGRESSLSPKDDG